MQHQQQATAHHVTQRSVGLLPIPSFTHPCRQLPAAQAGVCGDELTQEDDLIRCNYSAAVLILDRHLWSVCQSPFRNASTFSVLFSRSRAATLARLPLPDCRPPAATALDARAAHASARRQWATTGNAPSTIASWQARTLGRHTLTL